MPHLAIYHYAKQSRQYLNCNKMQTLFGQTYENFPWSTLRLYLCIIQVQLSIQLDHSCIFHPCIFARIPFPLPHFQSPLLRQTFFCHSVLLSPILSITCWHLMVACPGYACKIGTKFGTHNAWVEDIVSATI